MYYVSFFLFQTLGIFGVAIWVHVRAVWDHFKDWQNVRRQQQLMLLRDEVNPPPQSCLGARVRAVWFHEVSDGK